MASIWRFLFSFEERAFLQRVSAGAIGGAVSSHFITNKDMGDDVQDERELLQQTITSTAFTVAGGVTGGMMMAMYPQPFFLRSFGEILSISKKTELLTKKSEVFFLNFFFHKSFGVKKRCYRFMLACWWDLLVGLAMP